MSHALLDNQVRAKLTQEIIRAMEPVGLSSTGLVRLLSRGAGDHCEDFDDDDDDDELQRGPEDHIVPPMSAM